MNEWWSGLSSFEKTFFITAFAGSLVFAIQVILTFFGMDDDGGMGDGDPGIDSHDNHGHSDGPFQLFTLRNFVAFFTVFGWTGLAFNSMGFSKIATVLIALVFGVTMMLLIAWLFYRMHKLGQNGTVNIHNALHKTGVVYLPIPSSKNGSGKIQITFQGSNREMEAMTNGDRLTTGTHIKVTEVINNQMLLVEKA